MGQFLDTEATTNSFHKMVKTSSYKNVSDMILTESDLIIEIGKYIHLLIVNFGLI